MGREQIEPSNVCENLVLDYRKKKCFFCVIAVVPLSTVQAGSPDDMIQT